MSAQAGYEGEEAPEPDAETRTAAHAWQMLSNGHGGIDWSGLEVVCAVLGVKDVELLVLQLGIIKNHRKEE